MKWNEKKGFSCRQVVKLFLKYDQKREQAKSKILELYFRKFGRKSNTRNFNLDFYSSNSVGCP